MGYKYEARDILDAAAEFVLAEGLSALTFGRLAKAAGIPDRTIVYYFPTKEDLIRRTVGALGANFQSILDKAFDGDALDKNEVLRRAWPVLASKKADPVFAVFFEFIGLGAAGVAPFDTLATQVMENWIDWLTPRLDIADPTDARRTACATVAVLDGLLMLRHSCGPKVAASAASSLGVA